MSTGQPIKNPEVIATGKRVAFDSAGIGGVFEENRLLSPSQGQKNCIGIIKKAVTKAGITSLDVEVTYPKCVDGLRCGVLADHAVVLPASDNHEIILALVNEKERLERDIKYLKGVIRGMVTP